MNAAAKAPQTSADYRLYQLRRSQAYAAGADECRNARPDRSELVARLGSHPLVDAYYAGRRDFGELLSSDTGAKQ